ncbi:MAG: ATPase, T2SS/T4P/T4SS family [Clostridia bacterium]|nr:ATPase, T2SS/T4P/T4SS family [Clostridia bacterium]
MKSPVDAEIGIYFERYSINPEDTFDVKLSKLSQIVYQELFGFSIIDELVFDGCFNEVAANRFDYIWIQYKGIKRRIPNSSFRFISEDYYNKVVENRLISSAREEMNAGEPFVNCTLKNGYRVTAIRPPLSKHRAASIRCFENLEVQNKAHTKFMEEKMLKLVEILVKKGRRNIAIIGEQGSGKTTAADEIIIRNLSKELSIGLAEYTHELSISEKYPEKNVVELQYGKQFEPSSITEMFFRFNRDIVIYGEVRNPFEAFEMIKAMLRQARGSLFTFHSSSAQRMIHDLRQLLMQTGYYSDFREAQYDAADAVDLVIHIKLNRETGRRFVFKISEVIANPEEMTYSIKDLFTYDRECSKYLVNSEGLSGVTFKSCMEYEMTGADAAAVINLFAIRPDEKELFEYMPEESR